MKGRGRDAVSRLRAVPSRGSSEPERRVSPWRLFRQFFVFGCFTFGGGWSIVAQMEKEYVDREKLLTKEQLLDMIGVGRSLPGIMIGNITFLFGYHMNGVMGALACLTGMVIPPVLILMAFTFLYTLIEGNPWVIKAMAGVRAAVVPIIFSAVVRLWDGAFPYRGCYLFLAASFGLYLFLRLSPVALILLGAAGGLILCEIMERRKAP